MKTCLEGRLGILLVLLFKRAAGKASCPSLLQRTPATHAPSDALLKLPPATKSDDCIELAYWEEQVGNNLWQLATVLSLAANGSHEVCLPSSRSPVHEFFNLPDRIQMAKSEHLVQVIPLNIENGTVHGAIVDPGEVVSSKLLQSYIKTLGTEALRGNCSGRQAYSAEDVLTVHLRGGDALLDEKDAVNQISWPDLGPDHIWSPEKKSLWAKFMPEYRQPPCVFYESIFNGSWGDTFSRLRLVSKDDTNPCVSWLQKRFPGQVDFEQASPEADACKLMHARNVIFSNSLFSKSFGLWLNENIVKGFIPVEDSPDPMLTGLWYNFFVEGAEGVDIKKREIRALEIPGLDVYRDKGDDKKTWMVNYTGHLVQSAQPMWPLEELAQRFLNSSR